MEKIILAPKGNGNGIRYFKHAVQDAICQSYLLFQRKGTEGLESPIDHAQASWSPGWVLLYW